MLIIGITGNAGAGKTTAAKFLEGGYGFVRRSFAAPLKEGLSVFTGLPAECFTNQALKEKRVNDFGMTPREMMQVMGTECVRDHFCFDFWVKRFARELKQYPCQYVVIDDVRYENEAKWIREQGGFLLLVERNGISKKEHRSEMIDIDTDYEVNNCGTFWKLYMQLADVLRQFFKEVKMEYKICTKCDPNHYENCGTCFGFGVIRHRTENGKAIPIGGSRTEEALKTGGWEKCPECDSTPLGIQSKKEEIWTKKDSK